MIVTRRMKIKVTLTVLLSMTAFGFLLSFGRSIDVVGSNLIFKFNSIEDATGAHALSGSGNYWEFENFVAEATAPSLIELRNQKATQISESVIAYSAEAVFEVTTNVRTEAPWENAVVKTPKEFDWFITQNYWQGIFCDAWHKVDESDVPTQYAGEFENRYTIDYNDYVPVSTVSNGKFANYKNLEVEVGWQEDLNSFDYEDPSIGVSINYKFDWQITSLAAYGARSVQQLEDYQDKLKTIEQTISASLVTLDGSLDRDAGGSLSSAEWDLLATQKAVATRGVDILHTDSDNYNTWSTSGGQQSLTESPTEGVSFVAAGSREGVNTNVKAKLNYNIKPQVSFARQVFSINWGKYQVLKSNCWNWYGTTASIQGSWEGTETVTRNVAVRVNNNNVQQKYRIVMLCRSDVTLSGGLNSTTLLGDPNYARGDMVWDAFLTGDTKAAINYNANGDWRDWIKDIGVGTQDIIADILGPVVTIIVVVVVIALVIVIVWKVVIPVMSAKAQAKARAASRGLK